MFLGLWLEKVTGRKLHIWLGECHVHAGIRPPDIEAARARFGGDEVALLVHPECGCASQCMTMAAEGEIQDVHILSTEGMVNFAQKRREQRDFLIATETGILHRLRKELPDQEFHAVSERAVCRYMKMITLENARDALRDLQPQVTVPVDVAARARLAIERMVAIA